VEVRAYAKLNLSLDVVAKRPDGYHDILSVMQSVELCDTVRISARPGALSRASCDAAYLPGDRRNTAVRAAEAFFGYMGITDMGARMEIAKRIPTCAGMGGGSADAAAVLRGLNEMFSAGLSAERLEELGRSVGADVPFCVLNGTSLAQGLGERLTRLPPLPRCDIVILKPPFSASTAALFAKLNCGNIDRRPDTDGLLEAIRAGSLPDAARRMYNVFEDVIEQRAEIARVKDTLLDSGALGATMTGTGSAVFGIFDDPKAANTARAALAGSGEVFMAAPVAPPFP
jgi:4-diphosphocytidyl-2-C-methyl-D-erythritol kinase